MKTTEAIIADAELAACYLRALVDKGVPMMAAIQLTSSYVSTHQIADSAKDKPQEPWQGSDS